MNFEKLMRIAFLLVPLFLTGVVSMKVTGERSKKRPFIPAGDFADYLEEFLQEDEHPLDGLSAQNIHGSDGKGIEMAVVDQSSGLALNPPSGTAAGKGQQHSILSNPLTSEHGHRLAQQQQRSAAGLVTSEKIKANVLEAKWPKKPALGEGSQKGWQPTAAAAHQHNPHEHVQKKQKNSQIQSAANAAIEADPQLLFVRARLAQKEAEHTTLKNDIENMSTNIPLLFAAMEAAKTEINEQQMTEEEMQKEQTKEEQLKKELAEVDYEYKVMQTKLQILDAQVRSLKAQVKAVRENLVNPHFIEKDDVKCYPGNGKCRDCRKYLCMAYEPICHWNGQCENAPRPNYNVKIENVDEDENVKIED